jgi:CRP-like cAMP-binding protein
MGFVAGVGEQVKSARVNLPLTRVEIAQLLAITPEHLSRVLNVMEQEGIIRRDKGTILIPDIARLQR